MSERTVCIHAGHHTLCCQDCADIKNESLRKELVELRLVRDIHVAETGDLTDCHEEISELKAKLDEVVGALERIKIGSPLPRIIARDVFRKLRPSTTAGEGEGKDGR